MLRGENTLMHPANFVSLSVVKYVSDSRSRNPHEEYKFPSSFVQLIEAENLSESKNLMFFGLWYFPTICDKHILVISNLIEYKRTSDLSI